MGKIKCIAGIVCLLAVSAQSALLVQESFNYAVTSGGLTNGTQNGGTGFSGAWQGVDAPAYVTDDPNFNITSSAFSFGSGSYGNNLSRTSAGGTESIGRGISADLDATTELWFSVLYDQSANAQFAIGGASFLAGGSGTPKFPTDTDTNTSAGFGFQHDSGGFGAVVWKDRGDRSVIGSKVALTDDIVLVVGKIEFSAAGNDKLSLFLGNTDWEIDPNAAISTAEFAVDETNLDTLSLSTNSKLGFDEIMIGTTIGDVGITVIPEPVTLGMVAVFGGGILFIRRRFMMG
ncbi:hypothetical protein PDESU_04860 [Pontiella desulfatans]|uniref:PEP-CTERM protein-sorting domain-containing protein n=1 Tax=Pontiella desulfatans TaxID=2750659 RepID=A0A6C2U8R6_PONDE|nr:hypothetical protein [Pontiella desulfatans]VGO16269.1 hypothetical protein PDESU_04860 [Pontiella desulfatans]